MHCFRSSLNLNCKANSQVESILNDIQGFLTDIGRPIGSRTFVMKHFWLCQLSVLIRIGIKFKHQAKSTVRNTADSESRTEMSYLANNIGLRNDQWSHIIWLRDLDTLWLFVTMWRITTQYAISIIDPIPSLSCHAVWSFVRYLVDKRTSGFPFESFD